MMWQVPRMWEGGDVWIIGGGPSIPKQFNIPDEIVQSVIKRESPPNVYSPYMKFLHDKHVIGINVAYLLGDWVDMMFFGDFGVFKAHQPKMIYFPGLKVSCDPEVQRCPWIKYVEKDRRGFGISDNPMAVRWNGNSGAAAISIAANAGAKRIMLLGFDMKLAPNVTQHWHDLYGRHKDKSKQRLMHLPFNKHLRGFPQIATDARKRGIEIINLCPDSAIEMFKRISLASFLNEELNRGVKI